MILGSLASGLSWVSQVAQTTSKTVTDQIKNVDLDTVKSTLSQTTSVGWSLASDYISKAKDVVGEKYSTLITQAPVLTSIVGSNLQPSSMPGVGSNSWSSGNNRNNLSNERSDIRWEDWDNDNDHLPQPRGNYRDRPDYPQPQDRSSNRYHDYNDNLSSFNPSLRSNQNINKWDDNWDPDSNLGYTNQPKIDQWDSQQRNTSSRNRSNQPSRTPISSIDEDGWNDNHWDKWDDWKDMKSNVNLVKRGTSRSNETKNS